ncbi:TonB-linked outer membrane protein, SusC/RagA family [Flavobacterium flevense]|uniref:SusC/RagA family TonB-linked outer membrane protein n=1 Tax=Flavobacterium flevense TaxID=983 RepID=A0A4Y4B145_9FLAO|nr:SusC/RagA family TonB-linked outer membrane protein [Flavobacterium flevense]GEC72423.1 SusC/RagA family TonB-linked outer membrane protein [Flavobacterium flevense]SHL98244.1 TonB-linked outer membrane protein, SusC/RagA family [Flavobacterium flevense]
MKRKLNVFLSLLLLMIINQLSYSQERTVTGTVLDNTGLPLPGASVLVKGTQSGTQTDFDGKFSIKATASQILVFSYIGMKSQEIPASSTNISVKLQGDALELEGVVVTAFGIKRNPKQLGYSTSSVKSENITETSEPDLTRALSGKVAGVNVNFSTGVAGAANQITIRGTNSLTGNTNPLIIVDGVAYSNNQVTSSDQVTGGGGYESALSTLDPNDIAEINVLKSTAAAALYGSRAMNGVIVITTKSGSSKFKKAEKLNINIGIGSYFETIANLPDYQNTYGAGTLFDYGNVNGSWGARFDSRETIPTWASLLEAYPDKFGPTVPYVAKPNNVKDLFRTGLVLDKTIGFNYSGEDGNFNATLSNMAQDGYIPYNTYDRTSMSAGGNFKLSNKLTVGSNFSYSKTKQIGGFFGENQYDGASSSFARTLFLARNWDFNLPYVDPTTGGSVIPNGTGYDHPMWSWKHDQIITHTDRIVAGLNLNYKFNDNISASYRVGINNYKLDRDEIRDLASRADNGLGSLKKDYYMNQDIESTFLVNFNYDLTNKIKFAAILGNNLLQNEFQRETNTGNEFILPDIFNFKNVKTIKNITDESAQKRNAGVFADITLSYNDYLFLNATARKDWSSSLPKNNNSYFYPSVSASAILTDALNIKSDVLTFAKIRGSFARVGRDVDAEFLRISFEQGDSFNGLPTIGNNTSLGDQNITPEFSNEFEIGTDLEFFNRRITLDLSLYHKKTTDLLTPVTVATTSGYDKINTNAGDILNKGIEVSLTLIPIKTENFQWTFGTLFTKNKNEVTKLREGLDRIQLDPNEVAYAIPGQPFGVFYGTKFARDEQGNFLINESGGAIYEDTKLGIIGDPNADFKITFNNTFKYKGFTLGSQFDWKQGGDFSSVTIQSLLGRGVTKDTENRESTFIIPGYYADSDLNPILDDQGNKIPNSIQLSMNELYFSPAGGNTFAINSVDEASVYDGTVFRLRELSLTYDLPNNLLKKTPFGKMSFSIIGNNLWYFAPNVPKYTNFDPEVTSYGSSKLQGIETSAAPTAKRLGFKVNLTF